MITVGDVRRCAEQIARTETHYDIAPWQVREEAKRIVAALAALPDDAQLGVLPAPAQQWRPVEDGLCLRSEGYDLTLFAGHIEYPTWDDETVEFRLPDNVRLCELVPAPESEGAQ